MNFSLGQRGPGLEALFKMVSSPIQTVYIRNHGAASVCACFLEGCWCVWLSIAGFSSQHCLEKTSLGNLQLPQTKFSRFLAAGCVWSPLSCHVTSTSSSSSPLPSPILPSLPFLSRDVSILPRDGCLPHTWFQFDFFTLKFSFSEISFFFFFFNIL